MHEPFAVQKVDSLCDLEEDIQTLVVLSLLREAALGHPVFQVLLPTELHLDVQIHLQAGGGSEHYSSHEYVQLLSIKGFSLNDRCDFGRQMG